MLVEPPLLGFPDHQERQRLTTDTLERHSASPRPGYRLDRRQRLSLAVDSRIRVFLDTRYWLFLRDAVSGRAKEPEYLRLLELLRAGVSSGSVICPIYDGLFEELMHQSDPSSRAQTARLMDELSLGVALMGREDRIRAEIATFLIETLKVSIQVPHAPRWTRSAHLLGEFAPRNVPFGGDQRLMVLNAFDDLMWMQGVADTLAALPADEPFPAMDAEKLASRLSSAKIAHAGDVKSFRQAYLAELRGVLDMHQDLVGDVLNIGFFAQSGQTASTEEQQRAGRQCAAAIAHAVEVRSLGKALPTFDILASLYAGIRWDRARQFKKNDFPDFHHAAAALPNFDLFLTEGSLATLLQRNDLGLAKKYTVRIEHRPAPSLEALHSMMAAASPARSWEWR